MGSLVAAYRFFRDPRAGIGVKLLFVLSIVYLVVPFDAVPDFIPILGWLDDLGITAVAAAFLWRAVQPYRTGPASDDVVETDGIEIQR